MVLSTLGGKGFLIYPKGLNLGEKWRNSFLWKGKPVVELKDKESFGANLIVVKDTLICSNISGQTIKQLQKLGFKIKKINLSEFHKAGGGAHCLTLNLKPEFPSEAKVASKKDLINLFETKTLDEFIFRFL